MEHEIKLKILSEEDLYQPYDPDHRTLNPDVLDYIEQKLKRLHHDERPVLRIQSDEPVDQDAVKSVFGNYLAEQSEELEREKKLNHVRQLRMLAIGISFITLWLIVSSRSEGVGAEVLSIIGSFAIWEATNIWLIDSPHVRIKKRIIDLLSRIEIRFD